MRYFSFLYSYFQSSNNNNPKMKSLITLSILLAALVAFAFAEPDPMPEGGQYCIHLFKIIIYVNFFLFRSASEPESAAEAQAEGSAAALVPVLSMVASAILVRVFQWFQIEATLIINMCVK